MNRSLCRLARRHSSPGTPPAWKLAALFTALTALASSACADPAGPTPAGPLLELPAEGIFVLLGTPHEAYTPFGTVYAETLFVTSPTTYRLTGVYEERYEPELYRELEDRTAVPHADGQHTVFETLARAGDVVVRVYHDSLVTVPGPESPTRYSTTYRRSAPPPPPGPLASLELVDRDTVVLHGGSLDLGGLVVRGIDSTGRWVRNPPITLVTPEGWSTGPGLTLTAPHVDGTFPILLRSGPVEEEVQVAVAPDLRTSRWRLTWSCHEWEPVTGDSTTFVIEIDSARYAPPVEPREGYPFLTGWPAATIPWAQAALYATGTQTSWRGNEATESAMSHLVAVRAQRPDSVLIVPPRPGLSDVGPRPAVAFHRVTGLTRAYVAPAGAGGPMDDMCQLGPFPRSGEARFEELPVTHPGAP